MRAHCPSLPGARPAKPVPPFPNGSRVVLKCCPSSHPGVVTGFQRGKILVRWPDLNFLGKHKPGALTWAGQAKEIEVTHGQTTIKQKCRSQ